MPLFKLRIIIDINKITPLACYNIVYLLYRFTPFHI